MGIQRIFDGLTPGQRWQRRHPDKIRAKRVRQRDRRRSMIDALKAQPCADCGVQYPPFVMQFDHLDPSQKAFTIGGKYRHSAIERLVAEVAKCDVVCANCHAIRTEKLRQER